jgi:hypothetical protein
VTVPPFAIVASAGWNEKPEIVTETDGGTVDAGDGVGATVGEGGKGMDAAGTAVGVTAGPGPEQPETVVTARTNMAMNIQSILMMQLILLYFIY